MQEKEALERLLEAESVAATEAWLDNVVTTVYTDTPLEVPPEGDTVAELGNADSIKEDLEKELENEKQELLERSKFTILIGHTQYVSTQKHFKTLEQFLLFMLSLLKRLFWSMPWRQIGRKYLTRI